MQASLLAFLIVGAGGAAGAMARFGLTLVTLRFSNAVPLGTLISNLLGCFVMGVIVQMLVRVTWFAEGGVITDHNRLLFGVGFCGAFTTLSALVLEIGTMVQRDDLVLAFGYLMSTLIGGFAFFYAGSLIVRSITQVQGA